MATRGPGAPSSPALARRQGLPQTSREAVCVLAVWRRQGRPGWFYQQTLRRARLLTADDALDVPAEPLRLNVALLKNRQASDSSFSGEARTRHALRGQAQRAPRALGSCRPPLRVLPLQNVCGIVLVVKLPRGGGPSSQRGTGDSCFGSTGKRAASVGMASDGTRAGRVYFWAVRAPPIPHPPKAVTGWHFPSSAAPDQDLEAKPGALRSRSAPAAGGAPWESGFFPSLPSCAVAKLTWIT